MLTLISRGIIPPSYKHSVICRRFFMIISSHSHLSITDTEDYPGDL